MTPTFDSKSSIYKRSPSLSLLLFGNFLKPLAHLLVVSELVHADHFSEHVTCHVTSNNRLPHTEFYGGGMVKSTLD